MNMRLCISRTASGEQILQSGFRVRGLQQRAGLHLANIVPQRGDIGIEPYHYGAFLQSRQRLRRCQRAAASGDARRIPLPRPLRGADHCHFSFSGLKTAVATRFAALGHDGPDTEAGSINDLAAALQAAIADCLADRAKRAMARFAAAHGPATLVIAGGVAANKAIFERLEAEAGRAGFVIVVPPAWLCTDNAAMIAWAAIERATGAEDAGDGSAARTRGADSFEFAPRPRWPLDPDAAPPPGRGVRT